MCAHHTIRLAVEDYWGSRAPRDAVIDDNGDARLTRHRGSAQAAGDRLAAATSVLGELYHGAYASRRVDCDLSRLDDVVARPGHEHLWPDFLSTLLAEHRIHMAMFALDPRAELTARLAGAGLFGRVTAALQQEVAVLASGWNLNRISLDAMARKPLGLGPPDL